MCDSMDDDRPKNGLRKIADERQQVGQSETYKKRRRDGGKLTARASAVIGCRSRHATSYNDPTEYTDCDVCRSHSADYLIGIDLSFMLCRKRSTGGERFGGEHEHDSDGTHKDIRQLVFPYPGQAQGGHSSLNRTDDFHVMLFQSEPGDRKNAEHKHYQG